MPTIKSYYMVLMSEFANMVHTVLPYFRTSKKGVLARGTGSTRLAESRAGHGPSNTPLYPAPQYNHGASTAKTASDAAYACRVQNKIKEMCIGHY